MTSESPTTTRRYEKRARAAQEKATLDPAAIRALVERAGLDIVRLRGGLERVLLYAMGQPSVTADDVKQVVPAGAQGSFEDGGSGGTSCVWRYDHSLLVCCNAAGCWRARTP